MSDGRDKKIAATGGPPGGPPGDQRRYQRMEMPEHVKATITGEDGVEHEVTVKDISAGGAGLIVDGAFENDDFVELHMEGYGKIPARVKREFLEGIGVEFELGEPEKDDMEDELKKFRLTIARESE
ncbi:MAG: PilZ domain-containing protein [Proteobacteria bacterium]|nr:PilZ domain-containing protein [Pseudomonadota bacterium]